MTKRTLFVCGFLVSLTASAALVLILWIGGWQVATEPQRLSSLGTALLGCLGMAGLFGLGILLNRNGSFSVRAGPVEVELNGGPQSHG